MVIAPPPPKHLQKNYHVEKNNFQVKNLCTTTQQYLVGKNKAWNGFGSTILGMTILKAEKKDVFSIFF